MSAISTGMLAARGSQTWPLEVMTRGANPLLALAVRIADLAGIPAGALEADLRTDPARATAAVFQALHVHARRQALVSGTAPDTGAPADDGIFSPRLVLIVDQFEEVFTLCPGEQERHAFITALCAAAGTTTAAAGCLSRR
jgi:hypothetical protein